MIRPEFPAQYATTRRFTNGVPRSVTVSSDGRRVLFVRSTGPQDAVHSLWLLDVESGEERRVADARTLGGSGDEPAAERLRRERSRESGSGIVAYSATPSLEVVCFAVAGELYLLDLQNGRDARALDVESPVVDPRISPSGDAIAYVTGGALMITDLAGNTTCVACDDSPAVSWGLAEHAAAEEMGRYRGHWWAPDSSVLLAARVDESAVATWYITDGADPAAPPQELRYPVAGGANADVQLALVQRSGEHKAVEWDRREFPYLAAVSYTTPTPVLLVQSRDQRTAETLVVNASDGSVRTVRRDTDPTWLGLVDGVPALYDDGRLVSIAREGDTRRLLVDGTAVTPDGLEVRAVRSIGADGILIDASTDPTEVHVQLVGWDGTVTPVTTQPGVHTGWAGGGTVVVQSATLDAVLPTTRVHGTDIMIRHVADEPELPRVTLERFGERRLASAVLYPRDHTPGTSLPVVLDPYGGPGAQRVLSRASAYAVSQWIADQGFAVLVTDGRGSPGRGVEWEQSIRGDFATAPLQDQVDALDALCATDPDLDRARVGIRGWSFGGYLSLLAVLRRPDVFRAAVAGAPVTDWTLYDTHYTERYLGRPDTDPEAYERSSVLGDVHGLEGSLLILHGLNDDNVVATNSIRLSKELLLAGKRHECLLLPGLTHMSSDADAYTQLLRLEIDFFTTALA